MGEKIEEFLSNLSASDLAGLLCYLGGLDPDGMIQDILEYDQKSILEALKSMGYDTSGLIKES